MLLKNNEIILLALKLLVQLLKKITLKAEVGKLYINKLVNAATSLNKLKTKVDDLDVGILKTVRVEFKKIE